MGIQSILSGFLALLTFISSLISGFGYEVNYYYYEDIYYGTHERQRFDLAIPGNCDDTTGLVIYVHGGSWLHGDKSTKTEKVKSTAKKYGVVSAAINYRFASEDTDCFDMLDDIDSALSEIKTFCAKKGVNIDKVLFIGNSAGAHLSLLYAYSRVDTAPITPAAVIAYSAPTALYIDSFYNDCIIGNDREMARLISKVCGERFTYGTMFVAEEALMKASPLSYVTADTVPTLFAHGTEDKVINFEHAVLLEQALSENDVENELIIYLDSGHRLDNDPKASALMAKKVSQWITTYLRPGQSSAETETVNNF